MQILKYIVFMAFLCVQARLAYLVNIPIKRQGGKENFDNIGKFCRGNEFAKIQIGLGIKEVGC
jgi:hypothetical protein